MESSERARGSVLRRLVTQGSIYTVARVASQGAAFVLLPVYTHALGPEGLGVVEVANAARGLLTIVLLQGLHSAWFRMRYDITAPEALRRFETSIVWYLVLSNAALFGLVSAFGSGLWDTLAPGVPFFPLGALTWAAGACAVLGALVERKLQAEQRAWAFTGFTLSRTVGTLACVVIAVAVLRRGAQGKLEAEAFAGAVGLIGAFAILRPGSPRDASAREVKRALSYGWPLIPHGIAGLANDMIDRFMINAMLGLRAAGVYSLGYRIGSIAWIVMMSVNQALAPLFMEGMRAALRESDATLASARKHEVAQLCLWSIGLGTIVVQGVAAFGPELVAVLGTPEFADSWRVTTPVCAGMLAMVCYATLTQVLSYDGSGLRAMPLISGGAALVNIAANYVLIPRFHVVGAAYATLLSNSVMALLAALFATRRTPLPFAWSRIFALLALAGVGFVVLTLAQLEISSFALRVACKLGWLTVLVLAAASIAQLRPYDLVRLRRKQA